MSTITSILGTDLISSSRSAINTNFANLNTDKVESSVLTGSYATSSTIAGTYATSSTLSGSFQSKLPYGCSAYLSGSVQSIPDSTATIIALNAEEWDLSAEYNTATYKYTATTAGYYAIYGGFQILNVTPPANVNYSILVSGVSVFDNNSKGYDGSVIGSCLAHLNVNDYVQLSIYQDDGASRDLVAAANATFLRIQRIF